MKLAFFDNYKLGVVVGDKIVDVSAVTKGIKALGPQDVIRGVIEKWSSYKGKFAAAAIERELLASRRLLPHKSQSNRPAARDIAFIDRQETPRSRHETRVFRQL